MKTSENQNNFTADSDEQLMARFQAGAVQAFEIIFDRYTEHLINFIYRSLQSQEESEDLAQEVFLRIYKSKERYDPERPFRPWFFSIAARLVSNRLRDRKRRASESLDQTREGSDLIPSHLQLKDKSAHQPEKRTEQNESIRQVQAALSALPENQRTAVLLFRYEDMSYVEIAFAMEISISAVKSLIFRARVTLKELLSPNISAPALIKK